MCNVFSAIYLQTREFVFFPGVTNSHEDLIESRGLGDGGRGTFVRLEYIPRNGDYSDPDSYILAVDGLSTPDWFTTTEVEYVEQLFRLRVAAMIVQRDRKLLLGGTWIIADDVTVGLAVAATIVHAGNSTIRSAGNSTIQNAGNSTIRNAGNSTIRYAGNSTIGYASNSTIEDAGNSTIRYAGNSTIQDAGNSTIQDAGCSTIEYAGNSTIRNAGNSTIEDAGNSTIRSAGCSTIRNASN